jgi:hypothetical protein
MSQIELSIKPVNNVLEGIQCYEYLNIDNLKKIINNDLCVNSEEWNETKQLQTLLKNYKKDKITTIYKRVKGMNYGRFQPDEYSLARVRREIKCTITKKNNKDMYIDIDIVNCHFNILYQVCKKNNINCDSIKEYIKNRDKYVNDFIDEFKVSKKQAKIFFITILYGASFKKWIVENNIKIVEKSKIYKYVERLQQEMKTISETILNKNPDLVKEVEKNKILKNKKEYNKYSSVMSTYLQEYESRILETMYIKLKDMELITNNDCVLCYDGIMILYKNFDKLIKMNYLKNIEEVLQAMEEHITKTTGFKLKLTTKDFNDVIDLDECDDIQEEEDKIKEYEEVKEEFEKRHFKIRNPVSIAEINIEKKLILRSVNDFTTLYKNVYYESIDYSDNDDGKKRIRKNQLVNKWLYDENIRTYEKIDFLPRLKTPEYIYNEFTMFEAEKKENTLLKFEDSLIYKHIVNLCNEDMEVVKYFLLWLSRRVRKPTKSSNTCILFKSEEGAGKNMLLDYIGSKVIGSEYYLCTPSMDNLFGNFNAQLYKKIIVVLNEIAYQDSKLYIEKFKDAITAEKITINEKNEKKREITNTTGYIIFTNNDVPIKLDPKDRRFLTIECSNKYCCDDNYFTKLKEEMDSGRYDRVFYDYIYNMVESDYFDFTGKRPETEYNEILKEVHIPIQSKFLEQYYYDNKNEEHKDIYSNDFFASFKEYIETNNVKIEINNISFGLYLRKFKSIEKYRGNKGNKLIIDINELKNELIKMKHMKELENKIKRI